MQGNVVIVDIDFRKYLFKYLNYIFDNIIIPHKMGFCECCLVLCAIICRLSSYIKKKLGFNIFSERVESRKTAKLLLHFVPHFSLKVRGQTMASWRAITEAHLKNNYVFIKKLTKINVNWYQQDLVFPIIFIDERDVKCNWSHDSIPWLYT